MKLYFWCCFLLKCYISLLLPLLYLLSVYKHWLLYSPLYGTWLGIFLCYRYDQETFVQIFWCKFATFFSIYTQTLNSWQMLLVFISNAELSAILLVLAVDRGFFSISIPPHCKTFKFSPALGYLLLTYYFFFFGGEVDYHSLNIRLFVAIEFCPCLTSTLPLSYISCPMFSSQQ